MAVSHDKQFTLYSNPAGANPWKVILILEELELPYHTVEITDWADLRKPEYTKICPTGQVPALIDHSNNDFTIWDSGAIILYLVERYDDSKRISFKTSDEEALAKQYLMYQMSGQGCSYRELMWLTVYYPEDVPTVISRHVKDVRRILDVLSTVLKDSKNGFLVGGKPSYADISFLPWNWSLDNTSEMAGWKEEFPIVVQWEERLSKELRSVKKVQQARMEVLSKLQ